MASVICIENLFPDVDVPHLCARFEKYGRILSASIEYDKNFTSLRKGHISFDNLKSARYATKEMNRQNVLGKPMYVSLESNLNTLKNPYFTKIHIKNINLAWDECDLITAFEKFGKVVKVAISETDGKSNGYGFVDFMQHSNAKAAIEAMHGQMVSGKKLTVIRYLDKKTRENMIPDSIDSAKDLVEANTQSNNLHVKNLSKSMTEEELRELFQVFGKIQNVKIARDDANLSKGFGFVCFFSDADADKAQKRMNNCTVNSKILEVNFFQKKAARQQYLNKINTDSTVRKFIENKEVTSKGSKHGTKNVFSFSA